MTDLAPVGSRTAIPEPLFIFELANNHMGDVDHGLRVIRAFGEVARDFDFSFAFKMQFRELDTFIHPAFRDRMDIKYIKRFSETRLEPDQVQKLVEAIKAEGFLAICTPFDEPSVDRIVEYGFDVIKVASCSFTDWPLLERMAAADLPVIASTAGVPCEDIDNVVTFLGNRRKDFALMACVAQYPTATADLQLNQIDVLKARYPQLRVGYSTHEDPNETMPVAMAIAKGAVLFEKHVGLPTNAYPINGYSANPDQVRAWLEAARKAYAIAGVPGERIEPSKSEIDALRDLRRGVFLRRPVPAGHTIRAEDVFFAIPTQPGQITANDWSKYSIFNTLCELEADAPVMAKDVDVRDVRARVRSIVTRVKAMLAESRAVVPGEAELEISHHYGIERFDEFGITLVTVVNRDYCKKLIVVLPGQKHPEQYHQRKEETFHVLHGELNLALDGVGKVYGPGSVITIAPGVRHAFESASGSVFEEISSTHFTNDSFYTDEAIGRNASRKTHLRYWP